MAARNHHANRTTAHCRECRELVSETANICPACGYQVDRHNRLRLIYGGIGTLLMFSIVFAPVGVPFLMAASKHRRLAAGSVTTPADVGLTSHLKAVIWHHFSVEPWSPSTAEFTRGASHSQQYSDGPPKL